MNENIIFVELNECLIGEHVCWESFFLYLRNKKIEGIKNLTNLESICAVREEVCNHSLINFNNCFLRTEIVEEIHHILKNNQDKNFRINIISHINIAELIKNEIINDDIKNIDVIEDIKDNEAINTMLNTTDNNYYLISSSWKYYKCFFNNKKNIFVGDYFIGLIFDMISAGRTKILSISYGSFYIIWKYLFSITDLFMFWPYLFFLPSLNISLLKYVFLTSIFMSMCVKIIRTCLQLEEERSFLSNNYECVVGEEFLYDHYSVNNAIIIACVSLLISLIFGMWSPRSLLFAMIYSAQEFFFMTRTKKEYFLSKIFVVICGIIIIHPSLLMDMIKFKLMS